MHPGVGHGRVRVPRVYMAGIPSLPLTTLSCKGMDACSLSDTVLLQLTTKKEAVLRPLGIEFTLDNKPETIWGFRARCAHSARRFSNLRSSSARTHPTFSSSYDRLAKFTYPCCRSGLPPLQRTSASQCVPSRYQVYPQTRNTQLEAQKLPNPELYIR